jgi:hypothetical protein
MAESYTVKDAYESINDFVFTIDKNEISVLHPYIFNNSLSDKCIVSGKNLWPMYKFSNSGGIEVGEDFEFLVNKNDGSIMIRKERDVN